MDRRDTRLAFYFNNKYEENPGYELHRKRILLMSKFIDHIEKEEDYKGVVKD